MTKNQLIEIIRAALDCPSHFHKPTIINNDAYFKFGDNAIVICDQCVDRMREAIGIKEGEQIPPSFQFWKGKYPFKELNNVNSK